MSKILRSLVDDLKEDMKIHFEEVRKRLIRLEDTQIKDSKQLAVVTNTLKIVGATIIAVVTLAGIVTQIVGQLTK